MIPDDLYWVPQGVRASPLEEIIQPSDFYFEPMQFNIQIPQEEDSEDQKHIEDEILELLGITEEDLLLESVLQTYDHKLYIEELIKEALSENKPAQPFQAVVQRDETSTTNTSFKLQYERQYLSFSETITNQEDQIIFKANTLEEIKTLLELHCEHKDDYEDIWEYIKQKKYDKVLVRFSQIKGQARGLVFNYIQLNKSEEFMMIVKNRLLELSQIDSVRTELLLENFTQAQLLDVLDKQIPLVRLKILKNAQKDDKLMIEYFELLCQLHPNDAIEELKRGGYPQDECLKICRHYGNLKALAFLLERSGSVTEAINIHFDLFISELKLTLQRNNYLEQQPKLIEFILGALEHVLDICRLNTKRNDDESDSHWFLVLIRLTRLRSEFHRIPQFNYVLKCFNQVQTIILEEVLEKTKIKSLLENLNETMKFFEFQELKSTFAQLLSGQQYELAIQGQSTMLVKLCANQQLLKLQNTLLHGTYVESYCCQCNQIINGHLKVFSDCRHAFHLECSSEPLCKLCIINFTSLMSKLLISYSNRRSNRIQVPHSNLIPLDQKPPKSKREVRLEKLRSYQRQ